MNKNKKSLNIHKDKNISNNSVHYKNNKSIIMKTTNSINNIKKKIYSIQLIQKDKKQIIV